MTLAEQLAAIGGFAPDELIWIERDLAYAVSALCRRGTIDWSRHFPWLKGRMCELQQHRCCWCRRTMREAGSPERKPTFEHIIPLVLNGPDEPSNMAIACYGCNQARGSKPDDFPLKGALIATIEASCTRVLLDVA